MKTLRILCVGALTGAMMGSANMAAASASLPASAPPPMTANANTSTVAASTTSAHPKGLYFVAGPPTSAEIVTIEAERLLKAKPDDTLELKALPLYIVNDVEVIADRLDLSGLSRKVLANGTLQVHDFGMQTIIYFVKDSGQQLGWIQVGVDPKSGLWKFGGGSQNATGIPAALDALASMERVKAGSYEARELYYNYSGGDRYNLLWLKSDPGGTDLCYVPARAEWSTPRGLEAGKLYTAAEFVKSVQDGEQAEQARVAAEAQASPTIMAETLRQAQARLAKINKLKDQGAAQDAQDAKTAPSGTQP